MTAATGDSLVDGAGTAIVTDVVVVATFPFEDRVPLGDWQIGRALGRRGTRVLYVDPPTTIQAVVRRRRRPPGRAMSRVEENVVRLRTWGLLANPWGPVARLQNSALDLQVRLAMRRLRMRRPLVITMSPQRGNLAGIPKSRLAYWQKDRQYEASGLRYPKDRARAHRALLARADVATGVSDMLVEDGRREGKQVHLLTNAFDPSVRTDLTPDLRNRLMVLPRPRLVVLGYLSWRVDHELLRQLVASRPQWSFVLVGEDRAGAEVPGLHVLGAVDPSCVRGVLAQCDVGLVPYRHNAFNAASNPLKLYDYLGAGLPVVAGNVDLGGLESADGPVRLAATTAQWHQALQEIVDSLPQQKEAALRTSAGHTWDVRVGRLLEICGAAG